MLIEEIVSNKKIQQESLKELKSRLEHNWMLSFHVRIMRLNILNDHDPD